MENGKKYVEVREDDWVNGSGWSAGSPCEYEVDPDCEYTRGDLVDYVDDVLRLYLDDCRSKQAEIECMEGFADDSYGDTQYTMTVYAAHEDEDDDDYYYDEPVAVYKVWRSEVAKRLLKWLRAEKRQLDGLKKD